jgi:sec-independent protein translocase protein TatC
VLIAPLADVMGQQGTQRLIYTSLTEAFTTSIKISFLTALYLTLPIILNQIWRFVAPGLYDKERAAFLPFLLATPVLFTVGACMVYFFVMPMAWGFFLGFQTSAGETVLPIQLEARIGDYLDLIITLIFAFGMCFQLPVLLMLLARAGIITKQTLIDKRKYAFVAAFVIGAVLTPPDVLSQIMLALPLYFLYELSIFCISHTQKVDAE